MRTDRVKEKLVAGEVASVIWGLKEAEDIDECWTSAKWDDFGNREFRVV